MAQQDQPITPRAQDYSEWYLDVIREAGLADYSPVKGSMVLKPHGYAVWEAIRDDLDRRFKATGHVNAYFPLFIPMSFLSREAAHVEGFAKECAVVTHHRLRGTVDAAGNPAVEPDPEARLEEPLIVRPTSETIIWHMYGKWISSYRDLPILINQWANVVRWELKTRPFLRTAEFLWQEGHTAHATSQEAVEETLRMLQVYADFCHETLAVPVVKGVKSASERFAGAEDTYTVEAMMQNGWALQSGTSHFLGQNFARAFDVKFQSEAGALEHVWATSWGMSTRLVGAVIMTHSDDAGLVLPPRIAPIQVVIVPIWRKDQEREEVCAFSARMAETLRSAGLRVHVDDRDHLKPGAKYYEWERKGVPLRIEVGPRDVASSAGSARPRVALPDHESRIPVPLAGAAGTVQAVLDALQAHLLAAARDRRERSTHRVDSYAGLVEGLEGPGGWYLVPWCDDAQNEGTIKAETKATLRCFPLEGQEEAAGRTCFYSGRPATHMALFARAY